MLLMPRPRPPYLTREITRHGKAVWYVRIGKGRRVRIKGQYGTPEFQAAYEAAIAGTPLSDPRKPALGTLACLLDRYRETSAWSDLSAATRRQRENIFLGVLKSAGHEPYSKIDRDHIVAGRERRAKQTPIQARHFLDAMRGLFRWALDAGYVKTDPTADVKNPKRPKTDGFVAWTEEDVEAYQRQWPLGTKERVWLDVLLYTGLRRGDAVKLGRQHIRDGVATLVTEKTGTPVSIPILPILAETLAAGPCSDLVFVCGDRRQPLTKEGFGNMFAKAARAAGVRKSAHGVRKIGAIRAAENGATVPELEAIFGWHGGGMASLYTRAANRAKIAKGAITKLARTPGEHSLPAPRGKVRGKSRKNPPSQILEN
jgi:integrase